MSGTRSARYGRLLLFAALLFGIFTMHTVGHPAADHAPEHSGTVASAPQMPSDPAAGAAAPHHPAAPPHGMDPLAVCLAVLGVWGLALLTVLLLVPATRRAVGPLPGAGAAPAVRVPPPRPRKAALIGLSVLRI
ncbi:DUF6153 family protein [Streptomyces sp. ITFR-16]|uniref:DUF6153 family protein n=1 Tax=Streptomyces sp. ITFR-16 TaxID=3075198 RepID=UPI00288C4EBE|nr:DUF6153 family protein [Streptomyces sp. ITFR-16]WNI25098.1 DUF6153 family protein [Streptomyces sp. ITFR-16]